MDEQFVKARELTRVAKQQLLPRLRSDPNIVGVAFGRRVVGKRKPEGPAMVVYVMKKLPEQIIPPSLRLPRKVYVGSDSVEVDVVETGPFYTLAFTARERPAPSGISIGHVNLGGSGTLGCLVNDNTDGSLCILSNNHVLALGNAASLGDDIVQPGPGDGGSSPADDIATLKRFVTVDCAGTNRVDAAIGGVNDRGDVVDHFKDNLMPYPNARHRAIGLLFAGGGGRTLLNPIRDVMNQLDISFLAGAGAGAVGTATIGMAVEKVGRTTEYTSGEVLEIDVNALVGPYACGNAAFDEQIATCTMSCPGDSGSVVCAGGEGVCEDIDCGCGTSTTATRLFGLDVSLDRVVEKEFRERYLSRTLVGRYLMDSYFLNEGQIVRRTQEASRDRKAGEDVEFGRYLHEKYAADVRAALLQPDRSDFRFSSEHLEEVEQAVGRARQHMSKEEARAASELLELAKEGVGKNVREILDMLNNKELYERVVRIVEGVPSLKRPDCDCC